MANCRQVTTMEELLFSPAIFNEEMAKFTPRVDVSETDKEDDIKAELPGMSQNDIDVSISKDMITIRGEKKKEKEEWEQL